MHVATVCLRILLFPLVVRTQKFQVKTANLSPETQQLQMKMLAAKSVNDTLKARVEMEDFQRKHGIHPLSNMLPLLGTSMAFW